MEIRGGGRDSSFTDPDFGVEVERLLGPGVRRVDSSPRVWDAGGGERSNGSERARKG